jgi:hypothetical protein
MMDTVLFTDHSIVVFAILTSATALIFSVLGLATTHQIRFDMKDNFRRERAQQQAAASKVDVPLGAYTPRDTKANEWASLRDEFNAMVRESADTIEDLLDEQFRRRFGELMYRTARARHRDRSEATAEMSLSF